MAKRKPKTKRNPKGAGQRNEPPDRWQAIYLEALASGLTKRESAGLAGVSTSMVRYAHSKDPTFAEKEREAWEDGTDVLMQECRERAIGKMVQGKLQCSDRLLERWIEWRDPRRYGRHQRVDIGGQADNPVRIIEVDIPDREAAQKFLRITAKKAAGDDGEG